MVENELTVGETNDRESSRLVVHSDFGDYGYSPKPDMTGYQASLISIFVVQACCGTSTVDFGDRFAEVLRETSEHWERIDDKA